MLQWLGNVLSQPKNVYFGFIPQTIRLVNVLLGSQAKMTNTGPGSARQDDTVVSRRKARCLIGVVPPESVIMANLLNPLGLSFSYIR